MSSMPIKEKQLGLKKSSRPKYNDNDGFESKKVKPHATEDWHGKLSGKHVHINNFKD